MMFDFAREFGAYPSGRVPDDGKLNGETFRRIHLIPILTQLMQNGKADEKLIINIDGVRSFGSSFLEEAFGGLFRETGFDSFAAVKFLKIQCTKPHLQMYKDAIELYLKDALETSKKGIV